MGEMTFVYGAMGSSKTAQALITRFNHEERGLRTWLIKPSTDTRDGANIIRSRIGLSAEATVVRPEDNIGDLYIIQLLENDAPAIIIADEAQFFTPEQISELRTIADDNNIDVICYGLKTDFTAKLFAGSAKLLEIADNITEIKTVCECGAKAIVNARLDDQGNVVTDGAQVVLGGNERYLAMCHRCWRRKASLPRRKETNFTAV